MERRDLIQTAAVVVAESVLPKNPNGVAIASAETVPTNASLEARSGELDFLIKSLKTQKIYSWLHGALEDYITDLGKVDEATYLQKIVKGQTETGEPQITLNYGKTNPHVGSGEVVIKSLTFTDYGQSQLVEIETDYKARFMAPSDDVFPELIRVTKDIFENMFHGPKVSRAPSNGVDAYSRPSEKMEAGDFGIVVRFDPINGEAKFVQTVFLPSPQPSA